MIQDTQGLGSQVLEVFDKLQWFGVELSRARDKAIKLDKSLAMADQEAIRETVKGIKVEMTNLHSEIQYLSRALDTFVRDLGQLRRLDGLIVGWADETRSDQRWFVSQAWSHGNLMRTSSAEHAALFDTLPRLESWLNGLKTSKGRDAQGKRWPAPLAQLSGKKLKVYRVQVNVRCTGTAYEIPNFEMSK